MTRTPVVRFETERLSSPETFESLTERLDRWLQLTPVGMPVAARLTFARPPPSGAVETEEALDLKLLDSNRGDVWLAGNRFLCSNEFRCSLQSYGSPAGTFHEASHVTPLALLRQRWFWFSPAPPAIYPGSTVRLGPSALPGRVPDSFAGLPFQPFAIGVPAAAPQKPLYASTWFGSSAVVKRLLVCRASMIAAFKSHHGRWPNFRCEEVDAEGTVAPPPAIPPVGEDASVRRWTERSVPRPRIADVLAHLRVHDAERCHVIRQPPSSEALSESFKLIEQTTGGPVADGLVTLLSFSDGLELFHGALNILPVEVPGGSPSVPETLQEANRRIQQDNDWGLQLPERSIVFAVSPGEFPSFWALTPERRVLLLTQAGEVLGSGVSIEDWFADIVDDLRWCWAQEQRESPARRWIP